MDALVVIVNVMSMDDMASDRNWRANDASSTEVISLIASGVTTPTAVDTALANLTASNHDDDTDSPVILITTCPSQPHTHTRVHVEITPGT